MARTLSADDADLPNDPETVFQKHIAKILPAKTAADKAKEAHTSALNGYRAALKAAKTAGINTEALLETLRYRQQEVAEVDRHLGDVNRYLLWMKVPVNTQFGLSFDGRSIATQIEDAALAREGKNKPALRKGKAAEDEPRKKSLTEVGADGYDAGLVGTARDGGGYLAGTIEEIRWLNEYDKGAEKAAATPQLGKKGKAPAATAGDDKPKRRGGRPRKSDARAAAEAVFSPGDAEHNPGDEPGREPAMSGDDDYPTAA